MLQAEEILREAIWFRDQGRDRCTGHRLERHSNNWDRLGDVCHIRARSLAPERKYDPDNAFLMCRRLHIASDARGDYRLKIIGTDASLPLLFRMTDKTGAVLWERTG
jgi:hypothetical protein